MKKIIAFAILAAMMLTVIVVGTSAEEWDGTTVSASLKGEGTEASPFLVESAADLAFLAKSVNEGTTYEGKYITQTADIDLGGKLWTPIGDNTNPFSGIYDGKGNDVTGFYYVVSTAFGGFFGCIKSTDANQAAVLNLNLQGKIDDWTFNGTSDSLEGGLAGKLEGKATKPIVIANCVVDVDINLTVPTVTDGKLVYLGGIGGWNTQVTVVNTVNKGDISIVSNGRHLLVGGIFGNAYNNITLENVANYGNISGEAKSSQLAAVSGMIGRSNGSTTTVCNIKNSVNYGNVNSTSGSNAFVGGVVAQAFNGNTRNLTIENCANAGNLHAESTSDTLYGYAGGMLAYENIGYVFIKNCVNKGEVTAAAKSKAMLPGGILGVSNFSGKTSKFENCISTGNALGWTNATADIVVNFVSDAEVAVVDAAIKTIEDAQKATTSVTVNDVKYDFVVNTEVVPDPDPSPDTGDVTSVIILALVASCAGAVLTIKKVR